MSEITIKRVENRGDMRRFCNFPLKLYKNNPYYVPQFFADEMKLLSEKLYGDFSKSYFFIALQNGKVIGRIAAIINYAYNKKTGQKTIRFSRFDCIDSFPAAKLLFDACVEIATKNGLVTVMGPLGYTDLDREGMLYFGFDQIATFATTYNFEYYNRLVEEYGFVKAFDWFERKLTINKDVDLGFLKIAPLIAKRYNLSEYIQNDAPIGSMIKEKGQEFFDLINLCYEDLHGTVPITQKVVDDTLKMLKLVLQPKYTSIILNENGEMIAAGVAIKSIAKALNKCGGKLFPTGIFRLLGALGNKNKDIELMLIAVHPDYQSKGVTSMLLAKIYEVFKEEKIERIETNCNLEDNYAINNQWENFGGILHKKRRCYKLDLNKTV